MYLCDIGICHSVWVASVLLVGMKLFKLYAPCVLYIGQAFHFSPERALYILVFNQQIYLII